MKKVICIFLLTMFNCFISTAQISLTLDTLEISQIIYFHTAKQYYDDITEDSITIRLISEYEKPMFKFVATINNNSEKEFVLTTAECYALFEKDDKGYIAYIDIPIYDTLIIKSYESKQLHMIAPGLFNYVRDKENKNKVELMPICLGNKNDYSEVVYKILSNFNLMYKQENIEIISDTPNVVILKKYNEENIERYKKESNSRR